MEGVGAKSAPQNADQRRMLIDDAGLGVGAGAGLVAGRGARASAGWIRSW